MVNVVIKKLDGVAKKRPVAKKCLRSGGKTISVYTVDADSRTFDSDLIAVYKANVATARAENARLFGSADGFAPSSPVKSGGRGHVRRKK